MGVAEDRKKLYEDLYNEVISVLKQMCEGNSDYFNTLQLSQPVRERLDAAPDDRFDNVRLTNGEVSMRIGILLSSRYNAKAEGLKRVRNETQRTGGTHRYRYEIN